MNVKQEINKFSTIKIQKKKLYFFLLIFSSFTPPIFEISFPFLETLINYIRILSFVIIVIMYTVKRKKISKITFLFAISSLWYLFSTAINGGNLYNAIVTSVMQISVSMIVIYFIDDPLTIIDVFMIIFEILIYSNFYSLIRYYPNGYLHYNGSTGQKWYFLGMNNNFIKFFLPAIMISLIRLELVGNKYRSFILIAICYISIFIERSATSIVGLTIMMLYYFLAPHIKKYINIDIKNLFIYGIVLNILLTIFNISEKSNIIRFIFSSILNKNSTLTGRTRIWQRAKDMIKEKPIIGYGSNSYVRLIRSNENRWVNLNAGHAHNHWLQLLIEGGIIYLIIYIWMLLEINSKFLEATEKGKRIIKTTYICYFIICLTQPYSFEAHISLILILAYNINRLGFDKK